MGGHGHLGDEASIMIAIETFMAEDLDLGISDTSKTHQSGGVLLGHQVSLSTLSTAGASGVAASVAWEPGGVATGGKVSTTISVSGAALGDFVLCSLNLDLQETQLTASVVSAGVVEVVISNPTGSLVTLGSGTLRALVFKVRQ